MSLIFLREYNALALAGCVRGVNDRYRRILVGCNPLCHLDGFDITAQFGYSDCFKIGDDTTDIVGNVIVIFGINQGAAFAFFQKLGNIWRGKLLVDGDDNIFTANNGEIG